MTEKEQGLVPEWNVEDYQGNITPDKKLHEKTLPEVLKSLAEKKYDVFVNYSDTVTENYAIIEGIQKLFECLADEYRISSYNDALRGIAIHGYEIYKVRIGHEIEHLFKNQYSRVKHRDRGIIGGDSCNINLDECANKHTSFQIDKTISGALGSHSRKGCIPKYKLVTICMCYSLNTCPDLPGWEDIIQNNIKKFEKAQKERMGIE